ncbi:MAG: hypothetical protein HY308_09180 [Gammaproteobacteria bacterium]|nr:hypothetical protein [Gammaproteobacteria bacterium]
MQKSCRYEAAADYWKTISSCTNLSDTTEQQQCLQEVRSGYKDAWGLCDQQRIERRNLCNAVGEAPYDPDFEPSNFVNPLEIGNSVTPNQYFPLVPGNRWVYQGRTEKITVTVTNKTKLIEGVTCLMIHDQVERNGELHEDTDDWYTQDKDGNVWYCGELVRNFETFKGDAPADAELVDLGGSFKVGRDYAKPGLFVATIPKPGTVYRQEVALGVAEDVAKVVSVTGSTKVPASSCANTCLITKEYTPIEPGKYAHKYYAPGVGIILEVSSEGERVELIEFKTR